MSHELRLKFRRMEARVLKAFHKGFSMLLAVTIAAVLGILAGYAVYGVYATGLLVLPSVVAIAEVLLAVLDFLFEFLAGDATYEQAGVESSDGPFPERTANGSVPDGDGGLPLAGLDDRPSAP